MVLLRQRFLLEGTRLVHHRFDELQILGFRPELHFTVLCLPHIARLCCRIRFQTIVPDRMVEHRAELIMKRFQVYRRICFSCFGSVPHHLVLSRHHMSCIFLGLLSICRFYIRINVDVLHRHYTTVPRKICCGRCSGWKRAAWAVSPCFSLSRISTNQLGKESNRKLRIPRRGMNRPITGRFVLR